MRYFVDWAFSMFTRENLNALFQSLKRRLLGWNFLEMALEIQAATFERKYFDFQPYSIQGYKPELEVALIKVLNTVGNLGWWTPNRLFKDILSKVKDPLTDIYLLCYQENIIGVTVLHAEYSENKGCEIGFVAIHPKHRGKQHGEKLLSHIIANCEERGIRKIWLRTDSFRVPAIRTYLKTGFRPVINNSIDVRRWLTVAN